MTGYHTLAETEQAAGERLDGLSINVDALAVVSTLYRAATAIRNHLESIVLRRAELTWTGFVVLWVVWIRGEMETRHVAAEAGITKGTLTGVVKTLESRKLIERRGHPADGRLVLLRPTPHGERLMRELFPEFDREGSYIVSALGPQTCRVVAGGLRDIVTRLEQAGEERRAARKASTASPGSRRRARSSG